MKHNKLSDMDAAQPKVVAMEEHEPPFETLPEESRGQDIISTERIQNSLRELARRVDGVRDQATLEAYQWSYQALVGATQAVETKSISLEGFTGTITRKSELSKAIRSEITKLDNDLAIALETYAQDIKEDFGDLVKKYDALNRKIRATDADLETEVKKNIEVNHTRVFDMFMVKDVFKGKEPLEAIRAETNNLDKLVQRVARGVERIASDIAKLDADTKLERSGRDLPEQNTINLMFNRKVKIEQGQFETDTRKTRGPRKSHSWGQIGWIVLGTVIFRSAGGELAKVLVGDKKDSEAKVTNSLGEIHKYIRAVEGLDDIVDDLSGHVQDLVDLFKKVDAAHESALNRRVVPVMELATFIMKQIIDITEGTDKLFTKIVRKHS